MTIKKRGRPVGSKNKPKALEKKIAHWEAEPRTPPVDFKGLAQKLQNALAKSYVDIDELKMQVANIEASGRGAVRRLANALDQYQSILTALGKDHLTELDYEKDQARYHIMTAFNQALTAARARGGLIDEGNHIYLFQLGINGALAQAEVTALLEAEQEALNNGMTPSHEGIVKWLNLVADKFEKAPEQYAAQRNMQTLNPSLTLENKQ
jgi:hypothetical protein